MVTFSRVVVPAPIAAANFIDIVTEADGWLAHILMSHVGSEIVCEGRDNARDTLSRLCAVIVARDPFVCERLRGWLEGSPDIDVTGDAVTAVEAVSVIQRHRPTIIFLDPDVAARISRRLRLSRETPQIVFLVSNHDQTLALRHLPKVEFLDVHCSREQCLAVAERLARRTELSSRVIDFKRVLALLTGRRSAHSSRIAFRSGDSFICLENEEIDWIEIAPGGRVAVHAGPHTHVVSELPSALENKLKKRPFVSLSRGAIVNVKQIREVRLQPGAKHVIVLQNGTELSMARGRAARVLDELERLEH